MTPDELAEIEARLKAATPGPWQRGSHYDVVASSRSEGWLVADCGTADSPDEARANVDFIAHAPADIAALLAEVRRLTPAVKVAPAASLQTTLFTCRNCSVCVRGWVDGTVSEHGWHRIERIDGPNFLCPVCVADDSIEELRDEYPNAVVGGLVEVRDGE